MKREPTERERESPAQAPDADELLLRFVRHRDVACPLCGYNLRDLTGPVCPECRKDLSLTVGMERPRLGWFILTIAPGIFSGLCAAFLLAMGVFVSIRGGQPMPLLLKLTDGFGWLSGIVAIALVKYRLSFLRQSVQTQRTWAVLVWFIHIVAFLLLLNFAP